MIENKKALYDYTVLAKWTAGLELLGSEVKSLRIGCGSLNNAYAIIEKNEVFLINMDIPPYNFSSTKHASKRKRRLLLQKREIKKMIKSKDKHYSLIPLRVFFNQRGLAKIDLALCVGKKEFDKRKSIKERESAREMDRVKKTVKISH